MAFLIDTSDEFAGGEFAGEVAEAAPEVDLTQGEQPAMIDLTDAPTEELVAAKAS